MIKEEIFKQIEKLIDREVKRKQRSDKGKERQKYDSTLPKKYREYLARCNAKGIKMELTPEQFTDYLYLDCVYCGTKSTGIDRIDSNGDYTIDNCQPCCQQCNLMKFTYSTDEFIKQVKRIYKHLML
jgi:5-methylcytosine-specific restriction endonuclease McrA